MAKHLKLDAWKKEILAGNLCPYCHDLTKRIKGSEIYGADTPWADLDFMLCRPCWAYTGVHQKSGIALGSVANALLRDKRRAAHQVFDRLEVLAVYGSDKIDWLKALGCFTEIIQQKRLLLVSSEVPNEDSKKSEKNILYW